MGTIISETRKAKGLAQRQLADLMGVTDKAVSKWERDLSCPDVSSLSKLANELGITVNDLLDADAPEKRSPKSLDNAIDLVLRAITVAMGVAVTTLSALGQLDAQSGIGMLGIGLAGAGIYLLRK